MLLLSCLGHDHKMPGPVVLSLLQKLIRAQLRMVLHCIGVQYKRAAYLHAAQKLLGGPLQMLLLFTLCTPVSIPDL